MENVKPHNGNHSNYDNDSHINSLLERVINNQVILDEKLNKLLEQNTELRSV